MARVHLTYGAQWLSATDLTGRQQKDALDRGDKAAEALARRMGHTLRITRERAQTGPECFVHSKAPIDRAEVERRIAERFVDEFDAAVTAAIEQG